MEYGSNSCVNKAVSEEHIIDLDLGTVEDA